jgi:hypothetical protein
MGKSLHPYIDIGTVGDELEQKPLELNILLEKVFSLLTRGWGN